MRSFRHWTPRYIAARLRYRAFEREHPDAPWITQQAVALLQSWLKPTDRGIEWGSGRSTAWFGKRVAYLHSIEDNPDFFARLQPALPASVKYVLRDPGGTGAQGQKDGTPYVLEGETEPDGTLDFALVDGESRCYCLRVAMRKLKPGGLLILDNADWYYPTPRADWEPAHDWLQNWKAISSWRHIWTHNGIQATAFWVKPSSTT